MIGRHIDLIAITTLLVGIALYSGAREVNLFWLTPQGQMLLNRHLRSPQVIVPRPPRVPESPRIPYTRD